MRFAKHHTASAADTPGSPASSRLRRFVSALQCNEADDSVPFAEREVTKPFRMGRPGGSHEAETDPAAGVEGGFTRLDLLALVGTTMIVAALLVPALAHSGDRSSRAICYNNLRQLGQASLMYATDNRDFMAYPNWGNESGQAGWLYTPSSFYPPISMGQHAYATGLYFRYVRKQHVYMCPVSRESRYFDQRANKLSGYVMNGAVCGFGVASKSTSRLSDVWSMNAFLLWEPDEFLGNPPAGAFVFNDASSFPDRNEGMGTLHSTFGANVLTVSGEVKFVTVSEFGAEQRATGKSLVWWSPFRASGKW